MPSANTFQERDITVTGTPVQLDSVANGGALTGRYWVRVVNTSPTLRVFVSHSSGTCTTGAEPVDPYWGTWEDSIGPNVPVWARSEDGSSITVRFKQLA